jgi:P27 family predicted phage terminase small subunit
MKAPKHLQATGARLWVKIQESYEFGDVELAVLDVLCVAADRIAEAQALIAKEGVCIPDRWGGTKVHPAHTVEKDNSARMIAAFKALRLDLPDTSTGLPQFAGRPPDRN